MTFVVDGTVAALVAILVQTMFKPLLELRLKPDAPGHDNAVRAVALLLGVLLLATDTLIGGPWPATGNAWLLLVGSGLMSGLGAVGGYHLFSGSATPATTESAPQTIDYAALAASLAPALARLVPAVPAYTFPKPAPVAVVIPVAPEPAPQSPSPVPVAPATPPA